MNNNSNDFSRGDFSSDKYLQAEIYRDTRLPVDYARTLIPDAYRDPAFFALEQERVHAKSWTPVGAACEVAKPGDILIAEVGGQPIFVTRDGDGELRAFYNVCRHRGTRLCAENGSVKKYIRCPYHGWGYDLKGNCVGTPLFYSGEVGDDVRALYDMRHIKAFDKRDFGLLPVRVASWGCLVFVNLNADAPPLEEYLGDLPSRLAHHRLHEWVKLDEWHYTVNANWKLIAENYVEYYHLPWVHPRLAKTSRVDDHHRWQGRGMWCGLTTSPLTRTDDSSWLALRDMPGLPDEERISGRFFWLFPNIAVNIMPSHAYIIFGTPKSPYITEERTVLLSHPDSHSNADVSAIGGIREFWDEVNREDVWIVERVQQGLQASAYPGGRMCYRFEEPVHRFQNMVIDKMLGIYRIPTGDEESAPFAFASAPTA